MRQYSRQMIEMGNYGYAYDQFQRRTAESESSDNVIKTTKNELKSYLRDIQKTAGKIQERYKYGEIQRDLDFVELFPKLQELRAGFSPFADISSDQAGAVFYIDAESIKIPPVRRDLNIIFSDSPCCKEPDKFGKHTRYKNQMAGLSLFQCIIQA